MANVYLVPQGTVYVIISNKFSHDVVWAKILVLLQTLHVASYLSPRFIFSPSKFLP